MVVWTVRADRRKGRVRLEYPTHLLYTSAGNSGCGCHDMMGITTGRRLRHVQFVFLIILVIGRGAFTPAAAQLGTSGDSFKFDPTLVEQWKEAEIHIPPFPDDSNLLPVPTAPADTIKLYVHAGSVSRGTDRVLRFTLIVESSGGARNVLYDGIRCETREYKTYAIGTAGRTLEPVDEPKWRPIPNYARNAFQDQLYKFYACDGTSSARAPEDLIRRIKYPSLNE